MTSHPSQSLCARTEPLTSDDPQEVGGHRIEGRVADGGAGVLYAARRNGGEPVLLGLARGEEAEEALPEPEGAGVCAVGPTEAGEHEGRPWSVLPDQPGPDLRRHVAAHGALPEWGAVVLAAAVAEALAVLHGEETAHGEVGPDAVVLTGAGPRLLDAGLGRRAAAPAAPGLRGVPGWVAPEVYEDGRSTAAADVFGWACLVVLAATGREPFGESPASRLGRRAALVEMERRARQDAVDLEGVPASLRDVVARALSPEPGERPTAREALAAALRHLDGRDEEPTAARLRAALPGGGAAAGPGGGGAAGESGGGVAGAAPQTSGAKAAGGAGAAAVAGTAHQTGGAGTPGGGAAQAGGGGVAGAAGGAAVAAAAAVTAGTDAPDDAHVPAVPGSSGAPGISGISDRAPTSVVPGISGGSGGSEDAAAAGDAGAPAGAPASGDTGAPADAAVSGGTDAPGAGEDPDVTVITGDSTALAAANAVAAAGIAAAGGAAEPGASAHSGSGADEETVPVGADTGGPAASAEPEETTVPHVPDAEETVPEAGFAAPPQPVGTLGFGIYTEPVTPEGSAVAGAVPAAAVPASAPGTGFGIYTAPVDVAPAPVWNAPQEAAGTTATMVREQDSSGRTALLVNAGMVAAVLLAVLVVMLFRTGVV
ncbi:protein kinase domain-containing protein [Nocardiopsis protaetiae]|uniref:protein kinase domain-containing protein n=2 Tax=Nocardiopsis protaetiae TaxID=3382270 RepID=UPI00387AA33D